MGIGDILLVVLIHLWNLHAQSTLYYYHKLEVVVRTLEIFFNCDLN